MWPCQCGDWASSGLLKDEHLLRQQPPPMRSTPPMDKSPSALSHQLRDRLPTGSSIDLVWYQKPIGTMNALVSRYPLRDAAWVTVLPLPNSITPCFTGSPAPEALPSLGMEKSLQGSFAGAHFGAQLREGSTVFGV